MKFIKLLTLFLVLSFQGLAQDSDPLANLFSDEPEFLPVDEAFVFDFAQQDDQLTLSWQIAEGYYLYKKQFKTVTKNAEVGDPSFPEAVQIDDEFFGISDVFFQQLDITFPIVQSIQDGVVKIRYQGCAEAGLCYPPTTKVVYLSEVNNSAAGSAASNANKSPDLKGKEGETDTIAVSQQFKLADLLAEDSSLLIKSLIFLGAGILLAFTPCVFPMYPILSGIVIGQGKQISMARAFSLSFVYVQGMAITYSLLGLVVASAGAQFQAALQHPIILVTFIVVFVALAFAMFGAYEIQLPSSWQVKLNNLSNQQKRGNYVGVFVMGVISGLIASPCTTAPLTGILLYIAQSGDLLLGFTALYALSLGMGIPLIIFGVTGGKLLPKAGAWMNVVKAVFGFMLLVLALTFIERLVTNMWTELAWAALGLSLFTYFYVLNQDSAATLWKGIRALVIFLGLFGSAMYGYQQFAPTQTTVAHSSEQSKGHPEFILVKDSADFEAKLAAANAQGKTVMLDLYADWCVACKEFEKYTFPDPDVIAALSNTVWMQIDLTDNTPVNIEFQERFSVLGLPTILFFNESGEELVSARVTGFMRAAPFAEHVNRAL